MTSSMFERHTVLCVEAQQIVDNMEISTDERLVLLVRTKINFDYCEN